MSDDHNLPEGWVSRPLGSVAQLVKEKVDPTTVPDARYVGLEHVEAHTMKLLGYGRGSDVKSAKTRFGAGDVLYGKLRPYLNKITRPPFDGISSTDFLVFTESDDIDAGYLAQFLNQLTVANHAHHLSAGVELPRVSWKSLSTLEIAFPLSKSEQRAVVAEIERARGLAASADRHIVQARSAVERFRDAVLAAACSGSLTADWRKLCEPAESGAELVDRIHRDRLDRMTAPDHQIRTGSTSAEDIDGPFELPETWRWASWNDVADWITYGFTRPMPHVEKGIPIVTAKNINEGRIDFTDVHLTSEAAFAALSKKDIPQPREILVTKDGSIGRAAIVPEAVQFCVNQSVAVIRFGSDAMSSEYLLRAVEAPFTQAMVDKAARGSAIRHIAITSFGRLPVPIPPFDEQLEIARRVDQLLQLADALRSRIGAASNRIDRTSQAVLAKAFRGEFSLSPGSASP